MVHTAWITAVVFTALNAVLLRVRIKAENAALASASATAPESFPARTTGSSNP